MKVSLTEKIKTIEGKPMQDVVDEKGTKEDLVIKKVLTGALLAQYQDEQKLSGEDKIKRFDLANRIYKSDEIDLKSEEIALCKYLVAKAFGVLVTAQAWSILEGAKDEASAKKK